MSWDALIWAGLILLSYLVGGLPSAYIAGRLLAGRDIRRLGDRNSGAANVFRNIGSRAGVFVGVVDILKGAGVILLARALVDSSVLQMLAGLAVLAGHVWPPYLGFKGGRGAAAAIGVLLATVPALAVPVMLVALVALGLSRKATVAIAVFFIPLVLLTWAAALQWPPVIAPPLDYSYPMAIYVVAVPVLVGLAHFWTVRQLPSRGRAEIERDQTDERMLPQG